MRFGRNRHVWFAGVCTWLQTLSVLLHNPVSFKTDQCGQIWLCSGLTAEAARPSGWLFCLSVWYFYSSFVFLFLKCPCDNSRQGSWMCESVWHHLQGWLKFIQIRYSENHLLKSAQHAKLRLSFRVYFHIVKFMFVFPLKLTVPNSRQTLAGAGFQCLCENAH